MKTRSTSLPISIICLTILITAATASADTFVIDASHSQVLFKIRHLGISWVTGRFPELSGEIDYQSGHLNGLRVKAEIDATKIITDVPKRDKHLRSEEFFNVETFPVISFAGTSVRSVENKRFELVGDLNFMGMTKQVVRDGTIEGMVNDPWGKTRVGFTATTQIDRTDYGMTWNSTLTNGDKMLGDEVTIMIEVEAVKK